MGEVYKARDTRLERTVAVKVLPAELATDSQLRDRFEREARAISSLNHPHICVLHDIGRDADVDFLVLEFLEGQTLADRLVKGPLSITEALRVAIQICDALAKAHRAGIVHRDVKPANVMLTPAGAKLLDFGLAKAALPVVTTSSLSMMPTTPPGVTAQGTILGTFQYMAPEQIEGLEADARTDIFAFGALLFEMIAGRPAFEGKTRASLLGAILKDTPPGVSTVQPVSPPSLDRIVAACLEKDPDDRYQSARDLLRELTWIHAGDGAFAEAAVDSRLDDQRSRRRLRMVAVGAAVLAILLVATATVAVRHLREANPAPDPVQFAISPPAAATFGAPSGGGTGLATQVSVSPDGKMIVFGAGGAGRFQLYVRPLAALDARPLPGTEDGAFPFWSPDSRQIGFFSHGKLQKVSVAGGAPFMLCDAPAGRGGTWNRDNVIVFTPSTQGALQRVSAAGGIPAPASTLDTSYGESNHRFPQFLPDGRHFIYAGVVGPCCPAPKPARIKVGMLDSPETKVVLQVESAGLYTLGHLLFNRDGTLMAQAFDMTTRALSGEPTPIAEHIGTEGSRYVTASASDTGLLVYGRGPSLTSKLTWVDRTGRVLGTIGDTRTYSSITISPDEQHVAAAFLTGSPVNRHIWLFDSANGTERRFTFDPGDDNSPVWSPDGSRVVFAGIRDGAIALREKRVDGATNETTIAVGSARGQVTPTSWSRDGSHLLFSVYGVGGSTDIWVLSLRDGKATPLVETPAQESNAVFSPDGRWFAYQSTETVEPEVFVQPFPPTGGKFQVSQNGGLEPQWRADGKELFFFSLDSRMMAASIDTTRQFSSGVPVPLFFAETRAAVGGIGPQFAVTRDGQRFLIIAIAQHVREIPLTAIVNWPATLPK
jgi:Tol biopolymer transport system component